MKHFIYGAGGHGKVVLDAMQTAGLICDGFVDDGEHAVWCNLTVLKWQNLPKNANLHLAIGNNKTRENIAKQLIEFNFFNVIHAHASVAKTAQIQPSCFVAAQAVLGPDSRLGQYVIVNHGAVIDHDCEVGDFCHIAPNASLGGGVKVGKNVLVGAGAVILPNIKIADNVVIGAGAVVTRDVLTQATLVGIPATPI